MLLKKKIARIFLLSFSFSSFFSVLHIKTHIHLKVQQRERNNWMKDTSPPSILSTPRTGKKKQGWWNIKSLFEFLKMNKSSACFVVLKISSWKSPNSFFCSRKSCTRKIKIVDCAEQFRLFFPSKVKTIFLSEFIFHYVLLRYCPKWSIVYYPIPFGGVTGQI